MSEHDPKSYKAAQGKINTLYAALTLSNEANRQLETKIAELEARDDYPTVHAYETVCKANEARRLRIAELEARIEELTAALQRIEGRRNCYHDINGCGAAQDAREALKQEDE